MTYTAAEIGRLIEPDRIHRDVFLDPEIFALEMDLIFGRAWIYVGHESQIKDPGDYYTTKIGKQPIVMVRDNDGERIHVLHNRCGHKGAKVVGRECGNARTFTCNYHGWSFRTDGSLRAIPLKRGYKGTDFDKEDPQFGMPQVARSASYRGFVFASLSKHGPDLKTFLGEAGTSIDNMVDRSPEGELEVAGGVMRYLHDCNWKAFVENLNDMMHPMVVHQSVGDAAQDYINTLPPGTPVPTEAEIINPFVADHEWHDKTGILAFQYGHSYDGVNYSIHSDYSEFPGYVEAMNATYGKKRADQILANARHNTVYYPSLTIKGAIQTIRVVRPIAVNETIIETWSFRLKGAPDEMLQRTLLYSRLINSAASMVGPDDTEVYMRLQEGLETDNVAEWLDAHRYLGQDEPRTDSVYGLGTSDLDIRNQYKAWKEYMTADAPVRAAKGPRHPDADEPNHGHPHVPEYN
ncbi:MAG: aromatic ring-hydroxylating dioxygenase subunit alpha [Gammaproteobacteria bacterium]|nr:aromatic ring-hydroxylating dioxygenase subunit alpha [Gammaproteobacteria bacterium]